MIRPILFWGTSRPDPHDALVLRPALSGGVGSHRLAAGGDHEDLAPQSELAPGPLPGGGGHRHHRPVAVDDPGAGGLEPLADAGRPTGEK